MGLFEGDPTCRFCMKEAETMQHIICRCEVLVRRRFNVFGNSDVEPKDISTASVRDLCNVLIFPVPKYVTVFTAKSVYVAGNYSHIHVFLIALVEPTPCDPGTC
jgi:hypothetical protein